MLNKNNVKNKKKERDEIIQKTEEFLKNGGTIQKIEIEKRVINDNVSKEMIEKRVSRRVSNIKKRESIL